MSKSSPQSPDAFVLHPTLDTALSSLDVQLEEELTRYRRHRIHQHVAPTSPSETAPTTATPEAAPATGQNNDVVDFTQPGTPKPTAADAQTAQTQDYLQSSEELLKTLENSPQTPPSQRSKLTHWHLGTAAVLGIAVTLIGISWRGTRLTPQSNNPTTPEATTPERPPTTDVTPPSAPLDLEGPNLAETDGLAPESSDAPPAPPTGSATPQPSPSPDGAALPGRQPDLPSALLDQATPQPTPSPTPEAPGNIAPGPTQNDQFFYVLVDYTGEFSLNQARTAISDAYPRRFSEGDKIQMGAFDNTADAQNLVNRLQSQGITAKVYQQE